MSDLSLNEPDIIDDILARVVAMAPEFSKALAAQVERHVRDQWGATASSSPSAGRKACVRATLK